MHAHHVPERVTSDNDGVRIAEHALRWLKKLESPEAMTRVVLPGVARPTRRQAESMIRKEAEEYVWSVEVVGKTDLFATFGERDTDLPSIDLLEQFAKFVRTEQEFGNYDAAFAEAFAATGRRELEQAMMVLEAQLTAEEA
jgi:hypothetical protein